MRNQFAEQLPKAEDTIELFEQENPLTGFDVFIAMSHTAYNEAWDEDIGMRSIEYTPRVYGAYTVLRDLFAESRG
jgi:hypothetical protein